MLSYYTSVLILCWMALATLCILTWENDRISPVGKRLFYLTYALVAVSALAEWCGVQLDGRADVPNWTLKLAKCADYILTPMAGGAVVQMHMQTRWHKALMYVLAGNAAFQLLALPFGWTVRVDAAHHYYHGPLFPVYLVVCLLIVLFIALQFVSYGKSFKRRNRVSLIASMLLTVVAVALQELISGERTVYLGMTLSCATMFIHYTEFSQLRADDILSEQRVALMLSQIKPHFLYNALGSIEALCDRDPKAAKLATRKFSRYLRGNMSSISGAKLIPFETELQHTQLYLDLEQIRFGEALQVELAIEARDFLLPPLTLEPIVENAVKHGVRMNEDGRGTVSIASKEYGDRYEITATDDGPGFDPNAIPADGTHVGIRNVRERLDRICGGRLEIAPAVPRGTVVTIILPKKP